MTLLLMIRHGSTTASEKGLLTGWTPGVHLSERGEREVARLAQRLDGVPLAAVYSSPLERCRETAEPLAAPRRLKVQVLEDLGEVRYGRWTGRPLKQLARTKLWRVVQQSPSRARFPEGESLLETQERALRAAERIASAHPRGAVAVVSHADVIRLLVAHFTGAHTDLYQRLVVDPASVSAVVLGDGVPRILKVNDTGDLGTLLPRRRGRVRG